MRTPLSVVIGAFLSLSFTTTTAIPTWSVKPSGTANGITAMKFTDARFGLACGEFNTILKTSNGGTNWQAVDNGTIPNATFTALDALDSNRFFVARNGLYVTENGGASWSEWGRLASSAYSIQSVKAINDSTAFITKGGFILKTSDRGQSWNTCYEFQDLTGPMIFTGNNDTAYACSGRTWDNVSYGTIHRSVDGGTTWQDLELQGKQITALSFRDSRHGCYTTFDNMFYTTADAGVTWENPGQVSAGGTDYITGLLFETDSQGYAISMSGRVYKTADGGENWMVDYLVPRTSSGSVVPLGTIVSCGAHILIGGNDGFIIKNDGVLEIPKEGWPRLQLFPNPVQQALTIELPDSTQYESVRVYGTNGALLHTESISGKLRLQLEMHRFASGSYLVELTGSSTAVRTIITKY